MGRGSFTGTLQMVTCRQCSRFIEPAQQFERNSMGSCSVFEKWLDKFPKRRPRPKEYDKNYAALGGKVWWPNVERKCAKFEAKK